MEKINSYRTKQTQLYFSNKFLFIAAPEDHDLLLNKVKKEVEQFENSILYYFDDASSYDFEDINDFFLDSMSAIILPISKRSVEFFTSAEISPLFDYLSPEIKIIPILLTNDYDDEQLINLTAGQGFNFIKLNELHDELQDIVLTHDEIMAIRHSFKKTAFVSCSPYQLENIYEMFDNIKETNDFDDLGYFFANRFDDYDKETTQKLIEESDVFILIIDESDYNDDRNIYEYNLARDLGKKIIVINDSGYEPDGIQSTFKGISNIIDSEDSDEIILKLNSALNDINLIDTYPSDEVNYYRGLAHNRGVLNYPDIYTAIQFLQASMREGNIFAAKELIRTTTKSIFEEGIPSLFAQAVEKYSVLLEDREFTEIENKAIEILKTYFEKFALVNSLKTDITREALYECLDKLDEIKGLPIYFKNYVKVYYSQLYLPICNSFTNHEQTLGQFAIASYNLLPKIIFNAPKNIALFIVASALVGVSRFYYVNSIKEQSTQVLDITTALINDLDLQDRPYFMGLLSEIIGIKTIDNVTTKDIKIMTEGLNYSKKAAYTLKIPDYFCKYMMYCISFLKKIIFLEQYESAIDLARKYYAEFNEIESKYMVDYVDLYRLYLLLDWSQIYLQTNDKENFNEIMDEFYNIVEKPHDEFLNQNYDLLIRAADQLKMKAEVVEDRQFDGLLDVTNDEFDGTFVSEKSDEEKLNNILTDDFDYINEDEDTSDIEEDIPYAKEVVFGSPIFAHDSVFGIREINCNCIYLEILLAAGFLTDDETSSLLLDTTYRVLNKFYDEDKYMCYEKVSILFYKKFIKAYLDKHELEFNTEFFDSFNKFTEYVLLSEMNDSYIDTYQRLIFNILNEHIDFDISEDVDEYLERYFRFLLEFYYVAICNEDEVSMNLASEAITNILNETHVSFISSTYNRINLAMLYYIMGVNSIGSNDESAKEFLAKAQDFTTENIHSDILMPIIFYSTIAQRAKHYDYRIAIETEEYGDLLSDSKPFMNISINEISFGLVLKGLVK